MAATFKLTLAPRADSDGLHDVRLRITVARVSRFLNTGVAMAAKHWNEKATLDKENWVKSSHRQHAQYNGDLFQWLARAKALAQRHATWSADRFKATLANGDVDPDAPDFFAFCRRRLAVEQQLIDEAHARGKVSAGWTQGTIDSRTPIIYKLETWWQRESHSATPVPLPIPLLTEEVLKKYERYLLTELGNAGTTTVKNLKTVHTFIKESIRAKLLTPDKDPMALYEYPTAKPARVWLNQQEVVDFETVPLNAERHLARTVYYLQHYAHGSRIGAMLRLKWKDYAHGRLTFLMDKGDREKDVAVTPPLAVLLDSFRPADGSTPPPDSYILPFLPKGFEQLHPRDQLEITKRETSKINANLKRAAAQYGIDKKLSSHVARRTLATLSEKVLKGDLRAIGGLLGHTNTRTTALYLQDQNTHAIDEHARAVYEALGTTPVQQPLVAPGTPATSLADKQP
jgi:integrase/recombinase XerD